MKVKRIFSLLLAVCLAATLLTGMAFAQGKFTDVPADAYYARAVDWATEKGITNGTSPTTFSPEDPCTRAQTVTFLWRFKGAPEPAHSRSVFSDVRSTSLYYFKPVIWATDNQITTGTSDTTFSPDDTVTRAQVVTFLWRMAGSPAAAGANPFQDVPADAYYAPAVQWAVNYQITNGTSETTFSPDAPCTRGQIVTFLYRYSAAVPDPNATLGTNYPVVFVHGLLGWGSYDQLNPYIPYWGMTACDVIEHLRSCGGNVYAASVGPISSAWDRACELYAQLSGTVTDYGAAHAKLHGHARFGRDYSGGQYQKLIPGPWDAQHPVNLVGHSFGGATSRLLLDLLCDGSADEQAYMRAHPEEGKISPLFTGGKTGWIYSITALAAPSNGTTFIEANRGFTDFMENLTRDLSRMLGLTAFKGVYDFQLEHFGLQPTPGDDLTTALRRVITSGFVEHHDSAYQDLTIDRAMFINQDIQMQPGVYYISYYGNRTVLDPATGNYVPNSRMQILATPFSFNMGKYIGTTAGSFVRGYGNESYTVNVPPTYTGKEWQPNDGLVNVMSGRWPFHYVNGQIVEDPHTIVNSQTVRPTQRGIWYVMPEQPFDHLTFMGSIFNENGNEVNAFYHDVMWNIIACGG